MKVMVDLCVVPIGVGVSVSEYVAECERIIQRAGLDSSLHPYGDGHRRQLGCGDGRCETMPRKGPRDGFSTHTFNTENRHSNRQGAIHAG